MAHCKTVVTSNSIADSDTLKLLQSCIKPSTCTQPEGGQNSSTRIDHQR